MSLKRGSLDQAKSQIFVPYNGKIADITHADTNLHTLDLAAALSETRKIIVVYQRSTRIAGSGNLYLYPNEGTDPTYLVASGICSLPVIIANNTQRLQYKLTVASDDFDLYCHGYVVEV